MVDQADPGPRVTPGRPKGSGNKAPWIVLGLVTVVAIAVLISILLAFLFLRSG